MGFRFNTWRTDCRTPWVPEFTAKKPSREAGFSDILLLIPNKWSWTPNAWKTWVTKFAWKTWLVVSWLTLFGWSFLDKHVPRWVSVSVSCWKKIWRRCTRSHDKPVVRLFAFTILRIDQIFLTSTQLASYNKTLKNHNSSISPQIPKFQQASPEIPMKWAHNSIYNHPRYTSSKIRSKKLFPCTATEHRKSFEPWALLQHPKMQKLQGEHLAHCPGCWLLWRKNLEFHKFTSSFVSPRVVEFHWSKQFWRVLWCYACITDHYWPIPRMYGIFACVWLIIVGTVVFKVGIAFPNSTWETEKPLFRTLLKHKSVLKIHCLFLKESK